MEGIILALDTRNRIVPFKPSASPIEALIKKIEGWLRFMVQLENQIALGDEACETVWDSPFENLQNIYNEIDKYASENCISMEDIERYMKSNNITSVMRSAE